MIIEYEAEQIPAEPEKLCPEYVKVASEAYMIAHEP